MLHAHTITELTSACPHAALVSLLDSVELPDRLLPKAEKGGAFASLVRSILYQQLAGAAADAISKRFEAACKVESCALKLAAPTIVLRTGACRWEKGLSRLRQCWLSRCPHCEPVACLSAR